jgi:hypothetical protein
MFDNNVRFLETRFLSRDTSWGDDLILLEITKHYLVQKVAMYYSPDHIVDRALKVMSWDIPVLELLTFLFWTQKAYREMAFLLPILSRGFIRSGFYSSSRDQRIFLTALEHEFKIDDYYRDEWTKVYDKFPEEKKEGYFADQLPFADSREHYTRLGILLRIGEYMTYSEEKDAARYGKNLYDIALEKIGEQYPNISKRIATMDSDNRRIFFSSLQTQDERGLEAYFPDEETRKKVMELVKECCYFYHWETGTLSRVPIDV